MSKSAKKPAIKIRFEAEIELDTGDYTAAVVNLTNQGEGIDAHILLDSLDRVLEDMHEKLGGEPHDDQADKVDRAADTADAFIFH